MDWLLDAGRFRPAGQGGWRINYFGDSVCGWNSSGSSTANFCLKANKYANSFMGWGCAVIHELAHSCGWDHGGGFGIPDGTRDLDDFVQKGCERSIPSGWRDASAAPLKSVCAPAGKPAIP